jgi:hypothetical protein
VAHAAVTFYDRIISVNRHLFFHVCVNEFSHMGCSFSLQTTIFRPDGDKMLEIIVISDIRVFQERLSRVSA